MRSHVPNCSYWAYFVRKWEEKKTTVISTLKVWRIYSFRLVVCNFALSAKFATITFHTNVCLPSLQFNSLENNYDTLVYKVNIVYSIREIWSWKSYELYFYITRQDCHQPFGGRSFFDHEGLPYCETHYHAKRGSLCASCQKPITGRCITAMGKKFHPEHFVCAFCLKQLNKGTFKEQNDKPYCHPCFVKLFGWCRSTLLNCSADVTTQL